MDRDQLLTYIGSLRDRVFNQSKKNGVTKWALGVSILYLLLQSFPYMASLKYGLLPSLEFLIAFTHIIGLVVGITWFYDALKGGTEFSKFDYRFTTNNSNDLTLPALGFFAFEGIYCLCACAIFMKFKDPPFDPHFTPPEILSFAIGGGFYLIFTVALIYVWVQKSNDTKAQKVQYPTPSSLRVNTKSPAYTVFSHTFPAFIIFINAVYVVSPSFSIDIDDYKSITLLGFQLSLALCGVAIFIRSIRDTSAISYFEKLERDIVLHKVSEEEILTRLQNHYFGNEFSTWLKQKIAELEIFSAKILEFENQKLLLIAEVNGLDANLIYEKKGRLDKFSEEVKAHFDEYKQNHSDFDKCLTNIITSSKSDKYLLDLINEHKARLDSMVANDKEKLKKLNV